VFWSPANCYIRFVLVRTFGAMVRAQASVVGLMSAVDEFLGEAQE
jgi:hypothetical protein